MSAKPESEDLAVLRHKFHRRNPELGELEDSYIPDIESTTGAERPKK